MSWCPDFANTAYTDTLRLRKVILERQRLPRCTRPPVLEPASAEFLSALAAGSNSRHILQVGCGLSTIALAAAAKTTGTCLFSVNSDHSQQEIVQRLVTELGLEDYVEFFCEDPLYFVPTREHVDFVFITGDASIYIQLFDLLHLKSGAIVVADNALYDSTNEYIKHVRKQPGVDSSTLFVGRGVEITKVTYWEKFRSGRKRYTGPSDDSDGLDSFSRSRKPSQTILSNASSSNALFSTKGSSSSLGVYRTSSDISLQTKCKGKQEGERTSSIATQTMLSSLVDLQGSNLADLVIQATSNISPEAIAGLDLSNTSVMPAANTESSTAHVITVLTTKPQNLLSQKSVNAVESKGSVLVRYKNDNDVQTEITIEGEDQDMLLTDITLAFSEASVSVRRAKIATHDRFIEDVFYVVDSESQKPLQASQFDNFKEKLFKRLADRKPLVTAS